MEGHLPNRNERGIALVISMLILLVMTLLALVLMAGASLNRGLAGNDQRMRQALNIAEAGVGEAEARIRNQETLMDPTDGNDVCQVFNVTAGSVPPLGADSIGLATGQATGTYLNYTTPSRGPDVLTIAWKKAPGGAVMKYDALQNPSIQTATGLPIYEITATGRVGNARRTIVTDVIQKPMNVAAKGAMAADVPIDFVGNACICGYNHRANTVDGDGSSGRGVMPGALGNTSLCIDNETGAGDLPGAWSTGAISGAGASGAQGWPTTTTAGHPESEFYNGPWDMFGMSQAEFWSWVGMPSTSWPNWNGVRYYDNNTTTQDRTASLSLHSVSGEGFLYVDGDLRCNAGFTYRGLLYVEGDFNINGQAWILGGVVVKGHANITANGGMTILYSSETISQMMAKYGGQFVTLAWREN